MPTILMSVRLSPRLAAALDHLAAHLGHSPSEIVETLLGQSEAHRDTILRGPVAGPFSEKINLRLHPEAMTRLRALAAGASGGTPSTEPSTFVRLMLGHFLAPETLRADFPQVADRLAQDEALEAEDQGGRTGRPTEVFLGPVPGPQGVFLFLLVTVGLPLLILGIIALVDWLQRRRTETREKLAGGEDTPREPAPGTGTSPA
ncbi:MAG: hypothetical protein ACHQ7N_07585 [Candidatus Methylomirabilales bacterium]